MAGMLSLEQVHVSPHDNTVFILCDTLGALTQSYSVPCLQTYSNQ